MTAFNHQWMKKFGWPVHRLPYLPLTIAHRGASDYEIENSLPAFSLASDLFAEMWEIDVRLTRDGVVVISHDDNLSRVTGRGLRISEANWAEIETIRLRGEHPIPTLRDVVDAAQAYGAGLYIEVKSEGAAAASWSLLLETGFTFAVIGSFNAQWIAKLRAQNCQYPLSILIPSGADPFTYSEIADPDILHLCWRDATVRPQELVSSALLERAWSEGRAVVLWHEDRRDVLDALNGLPVLGICSNRPDCLRPVPEDDKASPRLVAHRGMNFLAPENTREATRICIEQRFSFVEIDVRTTSDGQLIVMHDATLDRTTNGNGEVVSAQLTDIRSLDAGSWFSQEFNGLRVPTLGEILDMAAGRIGVYIEIKDADPDHVLAEVRQRDMLANVFFWSDDTEAMRHIRAAEPSAILMATRRRYPSLEAAIQDYSANIIEYEFGRDDFTEIAECRPFGVQSMVFSLSRDISAIQTIVLAKPDLLNLDRPDLAKIMIHYPKYLRSSGKDEVVAA